MSSTIWIWKQISGLAARYNDVVYARPMISHSHEFLVYFGGDIQDLQENMVKCVEKKKYIEWSLDNTANILSYNFPKYHVFVVCPSRTSNVFSCFDNFVKCSDYGIPTFSSTFNALENLQELVKSFCTKLNTLDVNQDTAIYTPDKVNLTLMAFSKGCVVLNQFLYEFQYYQSQLISDTSMINFINNIKSIWWLDGGHGGYKDTWVTDRNVLESLAKLKIDVHVHVTPYQIQDTSRPWISMEESCFYNTLQSLNVPIQRIVHFENKPRSVIMHFNILKIIKET
ncbi:mitochondrial protein C2orf69 isoform X2 [Vespula squamosa]|uniref:Mitochondrial protein C2orf69 isoform X2 n=1 Tax=Vespula squamosa TaxID=30214 RepID=A0ABD2A8K6_VESSQ